MLKSLPSNAGGVYSIPGQGLRLWRLSNSNGPRNMFLRYRQNFKIEFEG